MCNIKTNKKGFSLVELLVAMAIIAVLISIAAYGIQIVQKNARNTKRRKIVEDMQIAVADVQANYLVYPSTMVIVSKRIEFRNNTGTALGVIPVKGFTIVTLAGCTSPDMLNKKGEENENQVKVCYDPTNLQVGVKLEGASAPYMTSV